MEDMLNRFGDNDFWGGDRSFPTVPENDLPEPQFDDSKFEEMELDLPSRGSFGFPSHPGFTLPAPRDQNAAPKVIRETPEV
jgi:hypothetical protein